MLLFRQSDLQFLSTLSLRRATGGKQSFIRMDRIFLSTLSLRRATGLAGKVEDAINISIPALLAESDIILIVLLTPPIKFLSTLSLRRATNADCNYRSGHRYFYPRSPCGERLLLLRFRFFGFVISIHALLAESDEVED